jgi:hypothetical protein
MNAAEDRRPSFAKDEAAADCGKHRQAAGIAATLVKRRHRVTESRVTLRNVDAIGRLG